MQSQPGNAPGRRARVGIAAALTVLLVALAVLVPSVRADAMVQVGGPPSGVPGGPVQAVVQNQAAGSGTWTIEAPPETSITAAESRPGTGLGQFSCTPVDGGARAVCGTSTWGVGNQVVVTMTVAATAAAPQQVTGTSTISGLESGTYAVSIVPPAAPVAPTITAPTTGSESIETTPTVTGTKTAGPAGTTGTTLTATVDGAPLCTVPAGDDTAWSCVPAGPLEPGAHTVRAVQTDRYGQESPAATTTFTVLAAADLDLRQAGSAQLLAGFPAVRTVTVTNRGAGEARGVTLAADTGGLQVPVCEVDGVAVGCDVVRAGIDLGTLAPGASRVLRLIVAARSGITAGSTFTIAARAASTTAAVSPVDSAAVLSTIAPGAPVVDAPASGSSTTDRTPTISGRGVLPGASVTVRQGETVLCTTTGTAGRTFACTPSRAFALGAAALDVRQTYGGVESPAATTRFTVVAPPPPPRPGGAAPAPGTGGGSAGGPVGGGAGSAGGAVGGGAGGSGPAGGAAVGGGAANGTPGGSATPPGSGAPAAGGAGDDGSADATGPERGDDGAATGGAASGGGDGAGSTPADGPLPVALRFSAPRIVPGTAVDMRGTLGPNASSSTTLLTFTSRMSTGMVYRSVVVSVDGTPVACMVATTTFSCVVALAPGEEADVAIRVFADAVNAPGTAVQQVSVTADRSAQSNALTVTTPVARDGSEAARLADQISTFQITEFPGAMVPLLAMLLFALAAAVAARPRGTEPDPTDPAPTTSRPPGGER